MVSRLSGHPALSPNAHLAAKRAALVAISLTTVLIWGEVLCRIFYRPPSFHPTPSFFNRLKGERPRWHQEGLFKLGTPLHPRYMRVVTNAYGFRGDEFAIPKPPNGKRILCLGDSVTFGWGVNNEDTYPALLQKMLRDSGVKGVEVLNAGIGDIGTQEELDELPGFLKELQIDHVIVGWYLNDSRPPQGFNDEFMYEGKLNHFFRTSRLVRHSYFLRMLYELVLQIQVRHAVENNAGLSQRFAWAGPYNSRNWERDAKEAHRLIDLARYDWGAAWVPDTWVAIDRQFSRLQTFAARYGFSTTVLALPVTVQAYGKADDYPQRQLEMLARKYGWGFADPLPNMKTSDPRTLFYDQCHLTPQGNALVARTLFEQIRPLLGGTR